jgi:hypothetical protein
MFNSTETVFDSYTEIDREKNIFRVGQDPEVASHHFVRVVPAVVRSVADPLWQDARGRVGAQDQPRHVLRVGFGEAQRSVKSSVIKQRKFLIFLIG